MLVRIAVEKLEECEALAKDNTLRKMKDVLKNESRAEAELLFEQWQTKSKPKIWMAKKTNGQGPPTLAPILESPPLGAALSFFSLFLSGK